MKKKMFLMVALIAISAGFALAKKTAQTSNRNLASETGSKTEVKTKVPSSDIPEKREFPLSEKINPCDDFHKYVCSEVEASFKLREDRSYHSFAFSDSSERILEIKKNFMKNLPNESGLNKRSQQLKDTYLACMNVDARKKDEIANFNSLKKDIDSIKSAKELMEYSNKNMPTSFWNFVSIYPTNNPDNPKVVDMGIGANLMRFPEHSYYENEEIKKDYIKILNKFFSTAYPNLKDSEVESKSKAVLDLQLEFIKTYPKPAERRQRWSERRLMTKEEFLKKFPNLHFQQLLDLTSKDSLLRVTVPESLDFINKWMVDQNLEVLRDYYFVVSANSFMDDAYPEYFKMRFDFSSKYFGGPNVRPDRQERCTDLVSDNFTKEMDQLLIPRIFGKFNEKKVLEVGEKIRKSILDGIEQNTWLSKEAKEGATKKIKLARLQLVQPHTEREWDFVPVKKYYPNKPVENEKLYSKANWEKAVKELNEPSNLDAWGMGPLTVNAYYSPSEAKFVMPIGILQYPFFNTEGSVIENLGAVGAVMGHELGHGIDDQGSKYDFEGKLKQWMPEKDVFEFNKRGLAMIDQFNKIGHNGKLTLGENVADLVGLTFAYNAAFPRGEGSVDDKKKFFIGYGRLWCSVIRPEMEQNLRKTDPHSAGWARINEQVKHQPGFQEAFSCKAGDKMTLPEDQRIKIW